MFQNRSLPLAAALAAALSAAPPAAGQASTASEALYEAFYLEDGVRRIDEAAERYRAAAALAAKAGDGALEAKARLGLARCLRALGDAEAADAELDRALELAPDDPEARAARERRDRQDDVDPELRLKIQALVQKLGGAEREQAAVDVKRIGDLAVPFLADGLRSRDVAVVESAAALLAANGKPPALDALEAAFGDQQVLFPHLLTAALEAAVPDPSHPVWERLVDRPAGPRRSEALSRLTSRAGSDLDLAARWRRLLRDADVEVRLSTTSHLREPALSAVQDDLVGLLDGAEARERQEVASALGRVEGEAKRAGEVLVTLLDDPFLEVREEALKALRHLSASGRVDGEVAYRAVGILLEDEDLRLVEEGVEFLRRLSGPWPDEVRAGVLQSIDRLAAAPRTSREARWLLDGRAELRDAELTELFHRATSPTWRLDDGDRRSARLAVARTVLERRPEEAARREWLLDTFADTADATGQLLLLDLADDLPAEEHARVALAGAASDHDAVRVRAYEALTRTDPVGHRDTPAFVFERLPRLPEDLAAAHTSRSHAAFRLVFGHPRPEWRDAAAAFHAVHGQGNTLEFLLGCAGADAAAVARDALTASNVDVRRTAVEALIEREGPASAGKTVAEAAAARPDPLFVLAGFGRRPGEIQGLPAAFLDAFVAGLPDDRIDADVLQHTYASLGTEQLARLVELGTKSEDPALQRAACLAVAGTAHVPALERMIPLLDSPRRDVREAAEAAVDLIRRRIERRREAELLGPAGRTGAIDRARKLLSDGDPVKRKGGALALGALGDRTVVPLLLDLLDDEDPTVREAALEALGALSSGAPRDG